MDAPAGQPDPATLLKRIAELEHWLANPCDGERCEQGGAAHCHRCAEAESDSLLRRAEAAEAERDQWRATFAQIDEGVQSINGLSIRQIADADPDHPSAEIIAAAHKTRDELTAWIEAHDAAKES